MEAPVSKRRREFPGHQYSLAEMRAEIRRLMRGGHDTTDIARLFEWPESDVWNVLTAADRGQGSYYRGMISA